MLLVWEGRPLEGVGAVLAVVEGNLSGRVLRTLADISTEQEFSTLAADLASAMAEADRLDVAAGSPSTFHIGFFRDAVQVSYGERGFVPLSRLLTYSDPELRTYMAARKRIDLPGCRALRVAGSSAVH